MLYELFTKQINKIRRPNKINDIERNCVDTNNIKIPIN